jgi:deazaflavin-dependent oxidoreductase (nitroreductase family)
MNRLEAAQVRLFGASGTSLISRTPVLVIETHGRRTGKVRRTPVAYWTRDDSYFIGGGAAGMTQVDWVANLRANPVGAAWVHRHRLVVVARELTGSDYLEAREESFRRWPRVRIYEASSGRQIPLFELRVAP